MHKMQNKYEKHPSLEGASYLIIESSMYPEIKVLVDSDLTEHLAKMRWCFEQSKCEVFAMDSTFQIPTRIFKYMTNKIYLWKYIAYLRTNNINSIWMRRKKLDLRSTVGKIITPDTIP